MLVNTGNEHQNRIQKRQTDRSPHERIVMKYSEHIIWQFIV